MPGEKHTRRFVLKSLGGVAATTLLAACASPAPPAPASAPKPAESKPAAPAAPAAQPAGTPLVAAGIGGAQPKTEASPAAVAGALKNPETFKAPKTKASSPTELTFWQYVGFHVDVQKYIANAYKEQHDPNVTLNITAYPGLNEQKTAVKAALAAASATPDIIAVEPGADCVDYYTNKGCLDFTKVFADDPDYKKGFWENALQLLTVNGNVVSVPAVTNTVIVYYNKKMFAENGVQVPETMDDLKKTVAAFSQKDIAPIVYPAGQDRNFPMFPFYTMVGGYKVDRLMRDADLGVKPWTSPELVEAATKAEELFKTEGLFAKGSLGIKEPDAIGIFASGKSAMFWGGQWMRKSIRTALPPDFDLGLFPFPSITAGGPKPVLSSVGITLTVNSRAKNPELAFEMIKAITGSWGKIEYTKDLGLSPNGQISSEAIAYQMQSLQDPLYPEFLKLQPTGTTRVLFTPAVQEALTQGMQGVIGGQKTGKQVMEEVEAASQKAGERKFTVG